MITLQMLPLLINNLKPDSENAVVALRILEKIALFNPLPQLEPLLSQIITLSLSDHYFISRYALYLLMALPTTYEEYCVKIVKNPGFPKILDLLSHENPNIPQKKLVLLLINHVFDSSTLSYTGNESIFASLAILERITTEIPIEDSELFLHGLYFYNNIFDHDLQIRKVLFENGLILTIMESVLNEPFPYSIKLTLQRIILQIIDLGDADILNTLFEQGAIDLLILGVQCEKRKYLLHVLQAIMTILNIGEEQENENFFSVIFENQDLMSQIVEITENPSKYNKNRYGDDIIATATSIIQMSFLYDS